MVQSEYDKMALIEIHKWKNPQLSWFDRAMEYVNWPLDKAGEAVLATPGVGDFI